LHTAVIYHLRKYGQAAWPLFFPAGRPNLAAEGSSKQLLFKCSKSQLGMAFLSSHLKSLFSILFFIKTLHDSHYINTQIW